MILRFLFLDHNYVLKDQSMGESAAKIYSKKTGMGVEYFTNQHGIQFYTGNMMLDKYIGKYNKVYGPQYGMCLEPQNYPAIGGAPTRQSPPASRPRGGAAGGR